MHGKELGLVVMLALAGLGLDKTIPKSYADALKITNSSIVLGDADAFSQHVEGTTESGDDGYDALYFVSQAPINIFINNKISNNDLAIDARPINSITPFDIKLKAYAFISNADNILKFNILSDDGTFNHRNIIAYDITNPTNIHEIPKNGDIIEVPLPILVNQSTGIYATWRVEMPRIIEGDINEDGTCDYLDMFVLANEWLQTSDAAQNGGNYLTSDVNLDRITDFSDFAIIIRDYGKAE